MKIFKTVFNPFLFLKKSNMNHFIMIFLTLIITNGELQAACIDAGNAGQCLVGCVWDDKGTARANDDECVPVTPSSTPNVSISPISKNIVEGTSATSFTVTASPAPNHNFITVSYTNSCGANGSVPIGINDTTATITIDTTALVLGDSCTITLASAVATPSPIGSPSQNDGIITISTANLTVISAANSNPIANDKSYTTSFETNLTGNVITDLPADSDPDGDDINVSSNTNPSHGTVTVNADGSFTYAPDISYDGPDSFTYTISDGNGGTDTATISITVSPAGNNAPIANDKSYTTSFETNLTGNVITDLPADSDPDGDDINVSSNTNPSHGTVTVNADGSFTYKPDISYDGPDSFTYTISDGNGGTDTATINITVDPSGTILPPIYQNVYSCGVFSNVLVSYEHIDAGTSANAQACFTENISYPEGELTGDIQCTPDACGTDTVGCVRQDPPANRYGHDFPTNSITGANIPSDPDPLEDLYYGDISYTSNNAGQTINFDPQTGYQGSTKKVMVIGDLYVNGGYTLSFEPGDYYFDSILIDGNNNEIILPNGGPVRIFVKNNYSVAMNNLATNTSAGSNSSDLFIYVAGSVIDLSSGGGTANLKAYFYVEGTVTLNNNSNNWTITGGITAEGRININGNNPDFVQDNNGSGLGLGDCVLCFERPSYQTDSVRTMITNLGGVAVTDLNITKVYDYSFTYNSSSIDSANTGTTSASTSGVTVDVGNFSQFSSSRSYDGIFYKIGDYAEKQQDILYDSTSVTFNLSDYNTSEPAIVKALHIANYMDGDRFYHVAVERCAAWPQATYLTGPFDAWDTFRGDTDNNTYIDDKNISTKISNKDFDLTIANLDSNGTQLETKTSANTVEYALYDHTGIISGTTGSFDANFTASLTDTFTVPHASREVDVGFKYCSSYDGAVYTLYDDTVCSGTSTVACKSISTIATWRLCYSSDTFATRPKEFVMNSAADIELLRSGLTYNFTVTANDENDAETDDYNQTDDNVTTIQTLILNDGTEDNASNPKLNGTLTPSGSAYVFADGISIDSGGNNEVVGITFDDVGIVTIGLEDRVWSAIDNDDTPQDCTGGTFNNGLVDLTVPEGAYVCGEENATFIPHHFNVSDIHLRNHRDGGFTYLSNDLNMSTHLDVNISAMNASNGITENFRRGSLYYENPVTVDLNVTEWLGVASRHPKGIVVDDDHKHDISTATLLGFGGTDANGTHGIAWNDTNETQLLMFNYARQNNQMVNPFEINGTDVNISVASRYPAIGTTDDNNTADIIGSGIGDRNATFLFARAKSSDTDDFYKEVPTTSINTDITVLVYCNNWPASAANCPGIDIANGLTNNNYLWLSTGHDMTTGNDGNITLTVGTASGSLNNTIVSIDDPDNGVDDNIIVTNTIAPLPAIVDILLDTGTNSWLIYNPVSDIADPIPFYRVEFIGESDWTGHGKTGHVVDSNASKKRNNRIGW